jgi:hypothetical protein
MICRKLYIVDEYKICFFICQYFILREVVRKTGGNRSSPVKNILYYFRDTFRKRRVEDGEEYRQYNGSHDERNGDQDHFLEEELAALFLQTHKDIHGVSSGCGAQGRDLPDTGGKPAAYGARDPFPDRRAEYGNQYGQDDGSDDERDDDLDRTVELDVGPFAFQQAACLFDETGHFGSFLPASFISRILYAICRIRLAGTDVDFRMEMCICVR